MGNPQHWRNMAITKSVFGEPVAIAVHHWNYIEIGIKMAEISSFKNRCFTYDSWPTHLEWFAINRRSANFSAPAGISHHRGEYYWQETPHFLSPLIQMDYMRCMTPKMDLKTTPLKRNHSTVLFIKLRPHFFRSYPDQVSIQPKASTSELDNLGL